MKGTLPFPYAFARPHVWNIRAYNTTAWSRLFHYSATNNVFHHVPITGCDVSSTLSGPRYDCESAEMSPTTIRVTSLQSGNISDCGSELTSPPSPISLAPSQGQLCDQPTTTEYFSVALHTQTDTHTHYSNICGQSRLLTKYSSFIPRFLVGTSAHQYDSEFNKGSLHPHPVPSHSHLNAFPRRSQMSIYSKRVSSLGNAIGYPESSAPSSLSTWLSAWSTSSSMSPSPSPLFLALRTLHTTPLTTGPASQTPPPPPQQTQPPPPRQTQPPAPQQRQAPSEQTQGASNQMQAPSNEIKAPSEQMQAPPQQMEAPPNKMEASPQETQEPQEQMKAPAKGSEAPAEQREAPATLEFDAKKSQLMLHWGGQSRRLSLLWLRDHCRCLKCYNHKTFQKRVMLDPFKQDLQVFDIHIQDGDTLNILWQDEHVSTYSVDWLMKNSYREEASPLIERTLWDKRTMRERGLPTVSYERHMTSVQGLKETLRNLMQFGLSFIDGAPVSLAGTQVATDRICPVQHTLFGGMFEFTSDGAHSDTAYGTEYLAAHTDNTYLEMPAGIQVFQCLSHEGEGGETLLVDGFHAVERLRQSLPGAVRCLSQHLVPHEYKEPPSECGTPGYHMYTLCPIIGQHPATGQLLYLRFNPYDRAPLNTIPPDDVLEFYQAYHHLQTTIGQPDGHLWVKLKPGTIVLIDNWRVMHGRDKFTGKRIMCGCYLPRDEWQSRARMLSLA